MSVRLILALVGMLAASPHFAGAQMASFPAADGVTYTTVNHAQDNRSEYEGRLRSLVDKVLSLEGQINEVGSRITGLRAEAISLRAQKEPDMDEFRRGEYCTACKRTRSQLGAGATAHFAQNSEGGVGKKPTAQEIAEREADWDNKIASKDSEVESARQRYDSLLSERNSLVSRILGTEIPFWLGTIEAEGHLRERDWLLEKKALANKVTQLQSSLTSAINTYNGAARQPNPSPAALEGLQISVDALKEQLKRQQDELPKRRDVHQKGMNDFLNTIEATRRSLRNQCSRVRNDVGLFGGKQMVDKLSGPTYYSFTVVFDGNSLQNIAPVAITNGPGTTPGGDVKGLLEGTAPPPSSGGGGGAFYGGGAYYGSGTSTPGANGPSAKDILEGG